MQFENDEQKVRQLYGGHMAPRCGARARRMAFGGPRRVGVAACGLAFAGAVLPDLIAMVATAGAAPAAMYVPLNTVMFGSRCARALIFWFAR